MEVITITSEAYQQLTTKLENLESYVKHIAMKQPLSDILLDVEQVCQLLKISKRTYQKYRVKGMITYFHVNGKVITTASYLEEFLKGFTRKAFAKPKREL